MAVIAAEALIGRLADWGVDTVFGLPGDGINGLMEGLRRHEKRVRFVLVHHEEAAALMACAHAKATGRIGVCLATSGPGGIHLANGLYDAKLDHAPVLAITGMQETSLLGTSYQQEVHLDRLLADVAEYNLVITNPAQLPFVVDNAIRAAYARQGVAHLSIPNDVQTADAPTVSGPAPVFVPASGIPSPDELGRAADVLNAGRRVTILVGVGARGAGPLVERAAVALDAPIIKSLLGKMVVADDSPLTTGGLGLLGTGPSEDLIADTDTLLLLGTNFPYVEYLPKPGAARVVHIELDPMRAGARLPTDVPVAGDVGRTLVELLPLLNRRESTARLDAYREKMDQWRSTMDALEEPSRDPIAPQYVASVISRIADDDAVLCTDSGTVVSWAARHFTIRGTREFHHSGSLATMGCGLPYANAIALAQPDRQVIAYVGDGAFAMVMAEFHTAARYGLPVKVVVNNNNSLGMILWEQMALGYPEHGVRFGDPRPDFSAWARSCGGFGAKVEKASEVEAALREAMAFDGPALVDIDVDPNEPPMPGKVTYEQAKNFAAAFLKGQPHRAAIATTLFKDKIQQLGA
ncbi:thiamine pyrophosphate-dependent enzyme [Allorhizocola rhizosphaerae]|uniref:thiamine pyrophosphate-dependent enzyme n=1 Tax=Allorhizocola rhizosphaerae TaxID=1872709 RepID=UPI000E3C3EC0|nr:thiamine pyrophosphate-dependent enzyme [Allorhizocola rhizosphaerae]